jgi:hypothetical protein
VKHEAEELPPGSERQELLKRAKDAETAARINSWITSPGCSRRSDFRKIRNPNVRALVVFNQPGASHENKIFPAYELRDDSSQHGHCTGGALQYRKQGCGLRTYAWSYGPDSHDNHHRHCCRASGNQRDE